VVVTVIIVVYQLIDIIEKVLRTVALTTNWMVV
jgi:hypothetical protein